MTVLEITLPDKLAADVERAGLLVPAVLEDVFRAELRARAFSQLDAAWKRIPDDEVPMSLEEIQVEVDAVRAERRAARS